MSDLTHHQQMKSLLLAFRSNNNSVNFLQGEDFWAMKTGTRVESESMDIRDSWAETESASESVTSEEESFHYSPEK